MSISYNTGIPAASHNPSNDQPLMRDNTDAINSIWDIDHISFNSGAGLNSGQHKQVTLNGENAAGAQTDPNSVLYTGAGTASAVAQLFWRNQNSIYHISPIRAWGTFVPTAIVLTQTFNIASIVRNSAGSYTITMNTNVVTGTSYAVFISAGGGPITSPTTTYAITSATVFTLSVRASGIGTDTNLVSFQILQL